MEFKCAGGEPAKLNLEIDLDRFRFLQAGEFDKAVKEMEDMDKDLMEDHAPGAVIEPKDIPERDLSDFDI